MGTPFTKLTQVGLVVRDKEKLIENMRTVFGVEPDLDVFTNQDGAGFYHGAPGNFVAELIFYRFAGVELEFIVPVSGQSIWQDFLDEKGEGLHHVLFDVESFEGAKASMAEKGISIMQEGSSVMGTPNVRWAYFDTDKILPFIAEMKNGREFGGQQPGPQHE